MADDIAAAPTAGEDERRLHELGYAQELRRRMSGFSNFAVSFTIISILSGCLTLYGYGMNTGGPAIIVWGWPIVGLFTLTVGLAMAEVCSSFPTAGGLYYWAAKLAPKNGPAWSWFTGWFNFLGQVAVTAGIDFGCAFFITAFLDLQWNFGATPGHIILVYFCVLLLHGVLNQFGQPTEGVPPLPQHPLGNRGLGALQPTQVAVEEGQLMLDLGPAGHDEGEPVRLGDRVRRAAHELVGLDLEHAGQQRDRALTGVGHAGFAAVSRREKSAPVQGAAASGYRALARNCRASDKRRQRSRRGRDCA